MEIDEYEPGVPSWLDLGSPDIQRTVDFYGALFGWEVPEGPEEAGGYRIATVRGRPVAGIGPAQNPGPPFWSTYVNVVSADDSAEAVNRAGGQVIVPPMDVLDAGRMAVFVDPVGAFFSVWQPGTHPGAQVVNEPGTWSWTELLTTDLDASKRFYAEVFGWATNVQDAGPMGQYVEWLVDGRSVAGMMQKPPMLPAEVPPHWAVYFSVGDADAAVARVAELGGTVLMPPMDIEPGRFAPVTDPTGATFNVIALKPQLTG